jgi:UPF0716 protein FxsA
MTRPLARKLVAFFLARRISRMGLARVPASGRGDVIAGETVDDPAPGSGPTVIPGEISDR